MNNNRVFLMSYRKMSKCLKNDYINVNFSNIYIYMVIEKILYVIFNKIYFLYIYIYLTTIYYLYLNNFYINSK